MLSVPWLGSRPHTWVFQLPLASVDWLIFVIKAGLGCSAPNSVGADSTSRVGTTKAVFRHRHTPSEGSVLPWQGRINCSPVPSLALLTLAFWSNLCFLHFYLVVISSCEALPAPVIPCPRGGLGDFPMFSTQTFLSVNRSHWSLPTGLPGGFFAVPRLHENPDCSLVVYLGPKLMPVRQSDTCDRPSLTAPCLLTPQPCS